MTIAVIASEPQRQALLPALRCAAASHPVATADTPVGLAWETLLFVVLDEQQAPPTLQLLKERGSKARVLVLGQTASAALVKLATEHSRIVGITTTASGAPEPWETVYVTRRVLAPTEATPQSAQFLSWGVTNVAWTPGSTADLRRVVKQVEDISRNLGVDRREASVVATAAHELLMNAIYDAPVGDDGQPLFAFDRKADVTLGERQRPTFRMVVGPAYIGLDVTDPFGRLPRNRFFDSILRGQIGRTEGGALDTSHGGAGLGLNSLFTSGSVLRAEVRPLRETHVSWMLRRSASHRPRDSERSLYFVPLVEVR